MTKPLLRWTGHPLADVGVATLCAMAGKDDPEKLTLDDLDHAGEELKSAYTDSLFVAYLSCVYTMNAPYTNPTMGDAARAIAIQRLLFPHKSPPDEGVEGAHCVFSGESATHLLDRSQMPMLTGAGVMNFFPAGLSEMPVAGPYLLAIQALALGGRRSEGKLLIVHCDDPQFTLLFAQKYLKRNRLIINLSQTNRLPATEDPDGVLDREMPGGLNKQKKPKYPDAKGPESLVMDDLVEVIRDSRTGKMRNAITSVTAYHLSNSGQGPSLEIINIPGPFVKFLFELQDAEVNSKWKQLVHRAWWREKADPSKTGKVKQKPLAPWGAGRSRNSLYNDLLHIFSSGFCDWVAATRFIRRHLLSDPSRYYGNLWKPPAFDFDKAKLIDWTLTALFLEKVLGMNKERIELIRKFADGLAELIHQHNDRRLFQNLVFTSGEWQYRAILTKAQMQYAKDRGKLALGFDEYIDVFLTTNPDERAIWSLVRDLISIRLVEKLFELKFFERDENKQAFENPEPEAA